MLRSLYSIAIILFFILACAVAHNAWKYLCKARLGSHLVIIFYVLAGIIALVHIVFFFILDLYPKRPILLYNDENFVFKDALEWIGQSALLSLGWLIALSMFHLTISLRLIFKLTTPEQARVHNKQQLVALLQRSYWNCSI